VASDNPWHATTLEWATATPPGHGNFAFEPAVYRGPYEYSRPDHDEDYLPQWQASKVDPPAEVSPAPAAH